MSLDSAMGGMKIRQRNLFLEPGYFRQEQELPVGKVVAYTDGKMGWMVTPQGILNMRADILKQAQGEIFRRILHLAAAAQDESLKVTSVDPKSVEISNGAENVRLEFEESTGLPARQMYRVAGMGGAPAEVVETYSDWRDVNGIKMPFKIAVEQNGKRFADAVVAEYKFNTGLKAEEISKKP